MKSAISVLLLFLLACTVSFGQSFQTFQTEISKWAVELDTFNARPDLFRVKDSSIMQIKKDPIMDIFSLVYYDENDHIGMKVDTKIIDSLSISVEGKMLDPIADSTGKYNGKTYVIDITETIKKHIMATYLGRGSTIDEVQEKVKKILPKYLKMGGEVIVNIWMKSDNQRNSFKLIPEKYGLSFRNEAIPINVQYLLSTSGNNEFKNLVNIYYPLQIIKRSKDRSGINCTNITKRLSIGPYLLATIGDNVSVKGGGILAGIGLSGKGIPFLGIGYGFSSDSKPFWVYTANPIEFGRLLFHPREIWTD